MQLTADKVSSSNHVELIKLKYSELFNDEILFKYQEKHILVMTTRFFQCKMFFGSTYSSICLHISTAKHPGHFKRDFANLLTPLLKDSSNMPFEYSKYECNFRFAISRTFDNVISQRKLWMGHCDSRCSYFKFNFQA
jgi:hypothetical protein